MKRTLRVFSVLLATAILGAAGMYFYPVLMNLLHPFSLDKAPIRLVAISPGTFMMGSNKCGNDAKPIHRVTISRAFYMGATEVTQVQFRAIMDVEPSDFKGPNLPVESIDVADAVEFCRRLTMQELEKGNLPYGMVYRLPTEAEWEYCCRAGTTTEYCCGNEELVQGELVLDPYAWNGWNSEGRTHPVGTRKPNAWGLYDMMGNVSELCGDLLGEYSPDDQVDPVGPPRPEPLRDDELDEVESLSAPRYPVLRGGLFRDLDKCRSASRSQIHVIGAYVYWGFRVVLGPPVSSAVAQLYSEPPEAEEIVPLRFVAISPGTFSMGSERDRNRGAPAYRVTISRGFSIGATEVTRAQYRAVVHQNPNGFAGNNLPVVVDRWEDAMEFCMRMTKSARERGNLPEGVVYRLPTEAEWEYCCRAGATTEYCFGDDESLLGEYAWFTGNSNGVPHPAGTKKPNAWGLFDMHGNVTEWCLDWFAADERRGSQPEAYLSTDPIGPEKGEYHVSRGGEFCCDAGDCQSARRNKGAVYSTGFRVVLGPDLEGEALKAREKQREEALRQIRDTLIRISPGSFLMGSEKGRAYEQPTHRVTISRAFQIGATEVTQAQYKAVMDATPSSFKGDDLPVQCVSHEDAVAFCRKLTEIEEKGGNLPRGMAYRLPTEAEWEYCCRAGSDGDYYFGDDESLLDEYAWFEGNSEGTTHPVGTRKPNAWGLYDMIGNVREWCQDIFGVYPEVECADPVGKVRGEAFVTRGGAWSFSAASCGSAYRGWDSHFARNADLGFRVVLGPILVQP